MTDADRLFEHALKFYRKAELPALYCQFERWRKTRPLEGLTVLDATPLFQNTFPKYAALMAAGAKLYVSVSQSLLYSKSALELLPSFGVKIASAQDLKNGFDIVLDNGAFFAQVPSKFGYAELTKSGESKYMSSQSPVFLADDSVIKTIETSIGTGDGYVRAMRHLGYDLNGKIIAVFGCGKVGRGIVKNCLKSGASVFAVDDFSKAKAPSGALAVDMHDDFAVRQAALKSFCIVSATGVKDALKGRLPAPQILEASILLANMGVEDEFGEEFPASAVLNGKKSLNFILEEPTHLKFIDPTLALHNLGAVILKAGGLKRGINRPSYALEAEILNDVRTFGEIAQELESVIAESAKRQ